MINFLINTKATYECGNMGLSFSGMIPNVVSIIIKAIQIIVPILLVVFGLIDLAKAVMAQKEDEIKKGQQTLIKRAIVGLIINFVSGDDDTISSCFNCFVNADVKDNACRVKSGDSTGL